MFAMSPRAGRIVALLASALVVLVVGVAPAGATSPCAKKVLADWFDNSRIDGVYALHCYQEAIDAVPPEIRDYSDAQDVIAQAMRKQTGRHVAISAPSPGSTKDQTPVTPPIVNTSAPSSVPLPLYVLGGIALALLAAGGVGYVSRRRRVDDE
jgi:hypothetical protein